MKSENIFSVSSYSVHADVAGLLSGLLESELGEKVSGITKLSGGINSEAFRVSTEWNNEYFAKKYKIRKGDDRDRLSTEFSALSFLWANGIRNIPEPVKACKESHVAIYRFINGKKLRTGEVGLQDVDQAADFAGRLHSLTASKDSRIQPAASEACFSIQEYMDCVERRVDSLERVAEKVVAFKPLRIYLEDDIVPFFNGLKKYTVQKAIRASID